MIENVKLIWCKGCRGYNSFVVDGEPEVLHIIQSGYEDVYFCLWENAYQTEPTRSGVMIKTATEILTDYGIDIKNVQKDKTDRVADIRNKLTPFWTLAGIVNQGLLVTDKITCIMKDTAKFAMDCMLLITDNLNKLSNGSVMKVVDGQWVEAHPVGMTCERGDCMSTVGRDYKKNWLERIIDPHWKNEPIFLCNKHAGRHKPIKNK